MSMLERALQLSKRAERAAAAPSVNVPSRVPGEKGEPMQPARRFAGDILQFDCGDHSVDEDFRSIKQPVLANVMGRGVTNLQNGNVIQVTSPLAASGKTFTAVNLAASIATELDWNVILIDGDTLKPRLSSMLKLEAPGLTDLLLDDKLTFDDVLVATDNPRLMLLPVGTAMTGTTELLGSRRVEKMVTDLARGDDRILIFDSPPLLQTTEARVLTRLAGQVIVVVDAGVTPSGALLQAFDAIERKAGKEIGVVLNRYRPLGKVERYGGEYGLSYANNGSV